MLIFQFAPKITQKLGRGCMEAQRSLMKHKQESNIFRWNTSKSQTYSDEYICKSVKHKPRVKHSNETQARVKNIFWWNTSQESDIFRQTWIFHELVQKVLNIPKGPVNILAIKYEARKWDDISSHLTFPIHYVDIQCQIHLLSIQVHLDSIHLSNIFNGNFGKKFEML